MNVERMRWLREAVEAAPEDRFDMDTWSNECGTVRCAGGWLCGDERAQAAGLTLERISLSKTMIPSYRGWRCFDALALFLGLPLIDASRIFDNGEYDGDWRRISRARVLERIDSVIKERIDLVIKNHS